MNTLMKAAGVAVIAIALAIPFQANAASSADMASVLAKINTVIADINEAKAKIDKFIAAVKAADPVLAAQIDAQRNASIAKFNIASDTAFKEYLAEFRVREREYAKILAEYLWTRISSRDKAKISKLSIELSLAKTAIDAALEKYQAQTKGVAYNLLCDLQVMIDTLVASASR